MKLMLLMVALNATDGAIGDAMAIMVLPDEQCTETASEWRTRDAHNGKHWFCIEPGELEAMREL